MAPTCEMMGAVRAVRFVGGLSGATGAGIAGAAAIVRVGPGMWREFVVSAAVFGATMFFGFYCWVGRRAMRSPQASGSVPVESWGASRRRLALRELSYSLVVILVAAVFPRPMVIAGMVAGNAVAMLTISEWLRRWERRQHATLLRASRVWGMGAGDPFLLLPDQEAAVSLQQVNRPAASINQRSTP